MDLCTGPGDCGKKPNPSHEGVPALSNEGKNDDKAQDDSNDSKTSPGKVAGGCAVLLMLVVAAIGLIWACNAVTGESEAERAAKDMACLRDIDCLANKTSWQSAGGLACESLVEDQALYSARWTDGLAESKFSKVALQAPTYKSFRLLGDKVEFQNGFGAWQRMRYTCEYDPINELALTVQVIPFN